MAIHLSINLNKIALLRNSRTGNFPNPIEFGRKSLHLGASGLTIHPRPDQRHIRISDIQPLRALIGECPGCELNMEGNPFSESSADYPGFLTLVEQALPHQCTLVPDASEQLTSDHGFDLTKDGKALEPIFSRLRELNIRSSLFIDPDQEQIRLAKELGAERIELYTGPYAQAALENRSDLETLFNTYFQCAQLAGDIGLGVNAGHDLNLLNLPRFVSIPYLQEVSIGHALTVDALTLGWDETVKAYLNICA